MIASIPAPISVILRTIALPNFSPCLSPATCALRQSGSRMCETRVGAVDAIDVTALIRLHIVGLDRHATTFLAIDGDATHTVADVIEGMKYPTSPGW